MIFVLDNGAPGLEHRVAFVEPQNPTETEALRRFEAALRADPFRAGAGIVLMAPDMGAEPETALTPAQLFDGPAGWQLQLFPAETLSDEELTAVLSFVAAWPAQRNVAPELVEALRVEAARRGFARELVAA